MIILSEIIKERSFCYNFYLLCEKILKEQEINCLFLINELKKFQIKNLEEDLLYGATYVKKIKINLEQYLKDNNENILLLINEQANDFINTSKRKYFFLWEYANLKRKKRVLKILIILLSLGIGVSLGTSGYYYHNSYFKETNLDDSLLLKKC